MKLSVTTLALCMSPSAAIADPAFVQSDFRTYLGAESISVSELSGAIFFRTATSGTSGLLGQASPYTATRNFLLNSSPLEISDTLDCPSSGYFSEVTIGCEGSLSGASTALSSNNWVDILGGFSCFSEHVDYLAVSRIRSSYIATTANDLVAPSVCEVFVDDGNFDFGPKVCLSSFVIYSSGERRFVRASIQEVRLNGSPLAASYVGHISVAIPANPADPDTGYQFFAGLPQTIPAQWYVGSDSDAHVIDTIVVAFTDAMLDLTGDGRFSEADLFQLEDMISNEDYNENFDFDGDSVLTLDRDASILEALLSVGAGSGLLGDGDGNGVLDCNDITAAVAHTFGSAVIASPTVQDGGPSNGYKVEFDADLDGDNDATDRVAVRDALLAVEPANYVLDNVLNIFDYQEFIALYNAQDPRADLAAPFGTYNIFDINAFTAYYNTPNCLPDPTP